jgi:hypothetical protein
MRIFVVIGTTGIYSEQLHWLADAWFHKDLANQRAIELIKMAASFGYRDSMPWKEFYKVVSDMAAAGNGDPNIRWNSGEPALDYFVEECELVFRAAYEVGRKWRGFV